MKNKRFHRRRGNDGDNDENLRGRLRELEKLNKSLKRRIRHLEKLLNMSPDPYDQEPEPQTSSSNEPKRLCKKCGHDDVRLFEIWRPGGEIKLWVCQKSSCFHREKV